MEVVEGLEGTGGVLLWPRFHRVRRYGALAARGFRARLESLYAALGQKPPEWTPVCPCPECGERFVCVMDEDAEGRKRPVLLGPSEASDLALLPGPGRVMGVTG